MKSNRSALGPHAACLAKIEELTEQISEMKHENANLKRLEDTIKRNNALFKALLANSSEGITLTGPDRRIVRVVKGLTGFRSGDLTGALIESLAVPEDQGRIVDSYSQLLRRERQQVRQEVGVPRADGTVGRFAITLTDMLDDPNIQAIVCNYADRTLPQQSPTVSENIREFRDFPLSLDSMFALLDK